MAVIFTADEFCKRLINIANNYKTLYVNGCFGAPMSASNKKRYTQNTNYNKQASRTAMINAASADTFGFDCVNLAKGVLWGWSGDKNKTYGGANYGSNGVPDCGEDKMIAMCSEVSTDFKNIEKGEALWIKGHFGVYIGDGLAVECTPAWENKVQITAVKNIGTPSGYNARQWTKHGKLPWIQYGASETTTSEPKTESAVYYTVQKGDNMTKIAQKYGTTLDALKKLNPSIKNINLIYVGQKIRVK